VVYVTHDEPFLEDFTRNQGKNEKAWLDCGNNLTRLLLTWLWSATVEIFAKN